MKRAVAALAILGAALFALFGFTSCMAAVEEQRPRPSASASPTPVQEPTPTDEPTYEPTEGGEAGGDPSAAVYYVDCAAAREAGAAPLAQGEPGYRRSLDRNGDGLACE